MPTVKQISNGLRFFFYRFDCNKPVHIHSNRENMTCKLWIEPVALAKKYGFSARALNKIRNLNNLNN